MVGGSSVSMWSLWKPFTWSCTDSWSICKISNINTEAFLLHFLSFRLAPTGLGSPFVTVTAATSVNITWSKLRWTHDFGKGYIKGVVWVGPLFFFFFYWLVSFLFVSDKIQYLFFVCTIEGSQFPPNFSCPPSLPCVQVYSITHLLVHLPVYNLIAYRSPQDRGLTDSLVYRDTCFSLGKLQTEFTRIKSTSTFLDLWIRDRKDCRLKGVGLAKTWICHW